MVIKAKNKILELTSLLIIGFSSNLFSQPNICGYVTDRSDSSAINGATVYLYDEYNLPLSYELRTTTDSLGYYEFRNVKPQKYSINSWTYFTFQQDTFAFLFQPGIFDVDTSASVFNHPCFYVNFEFELGVSDSSYNELEERFLSIPFFSENSNSGKRDWPVELLQFLIPWKVTTIDSLYNSIPSIEVRRKDW